MKGGEWADWLEEAHAMIAEWEQHRHTGLMLPLAEAAKLAELIAIHLHGAFEQGRGADPR